MTIWTKNDCGGGNDNKDKGSNSNHGGHRQLSTKVQIGGKGRGNSDGSSESNGNSNKDNNGANKGNSSGNGGRLWAAAIAEGGSEASYHT